MKIDVTITVGVNKLSIQIPQAGILLELPNIVAYELPSQKVVAVGREAEDMEKEDPAEWQQTKPEVGFAPAFDVQAFNAKLASAVIEFQIVAARTKLRPGSQSLIGFLDQFECSLWFDKYESLPYDARKAFELSVQEAAGVNTISVNGQSVGWPVWQRKSAVWSLAVINLTLATGVYLYSYLRLLRYLFRFLPPELTGPIVTWQTAFVAAAGCIVIIAICWATMYVIAFLGAVAWMAIVGRLLPNSLLRAYLSNYQKRFSLSLLTPVANWLLYEPKTAVA